MNKLAIKRVFIRDLEGSYFKICGISNPQDRFGEYYVKIVLPTFEHTSWIGQERDDNFNPTSYEEYKMSIQEFTYHYNGGVAHYKTTDPKYLDQIKELPCLQESKGLDLLTYTIFSLSPWKPHDAENIAETDYVLKHPFNEMPRDIQITLSNDPDVRMTNIGKAKMLTVDTFPLKEPRVYMTVVDSVHRERSDNPILITQLYRPTNSQNK